MYTKASTPFKGLLAKYILKIQNGGLQDFKLPNSAVTA